MEYLRPINVKVGDKIVIDTLVCDDNDLINWLINKGYWENCLRFSDILTVDKLDEKESNVVWIKDCPYPIFLEDVMLVEK